MANIKANDKSHRHDERVHLNHQAQKSAMKTEIKKARANAHTDEDLRPAIKKIDTVARKGIIHKNKAARLKSRLAKKVHAEAAQEQSAE